MTQDGENLLYFLALAAETAQERKNRTDRILERKLFYEDQHRHHRGGHRPLPQRPAGPCRPACARPTRWKRCTSLAPPEEEKQDDTAPNGIVSISAKDLQDKEFKPIKWVVEGLLPLKVWRCWWPRPSTAKAG